MKQNTLFSIGKPSPAPKAVFTGTVMLNGMYYETSTGMFVSFVEGLRYWEDYNSPGPKDWETKLKKERSIYAGPKEYHPKAKRIDGVHD